jgi:prevent-host-death family protein
MTTKVNATKAKAQFLAMLDDVENGEEFEITRHGRTIARITPARNGRVVWGKHAGIAKSNVPPEELYSTGETWEAS